MATPKYDVIVVGAGVSGLTCATLLRERGLQVAVIEKGDRVGGRIKTDEHEGFLLDHGFQILLTSYPAVAEHLDLVSLDAKPFLPGADVWCDGRFHRFSDPWRDPGAAWATFVSGVGTLFDKLRVAGLRASVNRGDLDSIYERDEVATLDLLKSRGFSDRVIQRFFVPFLGGVFLEPELRTSSRMFEFVFRMFSRGSAVLPCRGMRAIAEQLAGRLDSEAIRLKLEVDQLTDRGVGVAGDSEWVADAVVVATEAPAAARLLKRPAPPPAQRVRCLYFAAEAPPATAPILMLNGEGPQAGPVNNVCVPTQVQPGYSANGQALISVSVLGAHDRSDDGDGIASAAIEQLRAWFGEQVDGWRRLRDYAIAYALPNQEPPALDPVAKPNQVSDRVFVCGDHTSTASIQGAMESGARTARRVAAILGRD